MRSKLLKFAVLLLGICVLATTPLMAQGITTSAIYGKIVDNTGSPLPGANIIATHIPSGTTYGTTSRDNGDFTLPGLRVGGPYTIAVSFVGYAKQEVSDIQLQLSQGVRQDFRLVEEALRVGEVVVTAERSTVMSATRTGAATSVGRQTLDALPTISRRITDFLRLTPEASGYSFAGQDNRLNNMTVDGSYFNNSFGLAGQPGDRTGVSPISLDAIEQVQVNIAPFDVRQGNFVGAGINTVTRSGGNEFSGSAYYQFRDESMVGTKAKDLTYDPGTFKYKLMGFRLGGPIVKNKLFFFVNYEGEETTEPGTTFMANTGGQTVAGNVTRVLKSDLDQLSSYLKTNFGYETGPYQGYDHLTPAKKFIAKLDFNIDERNKLSLRYNHLDSDTDVLMSNSSSLGFGSRRTSTSALNFRNSNYGIMENIRSIVGEWNSIIGDNMANNLIVGYSYHDESRSSRGTFFPMVDILSGGSTYTSFGFEPFTPSNELRYSSYQLQNNFTVFTANHYLTFGVSAEMYESENIFFPGSQSVYVYNSLADFYTDANAYLNKTTSPVTTRRFQVRWSNIPDMSKPVQPLEVFYAGVYAQDEWQVSDELRVTLGLRLDVPFFGDTGFENLEVETFTFMDETGKLLRYSTKKLPDPNILWSPRVGFNLDIFGDRSTQLRGGTGIFSGRPAYVWISNQIGANGILTGFERLDNTRLRPFNPDPNRYKPISVTGAPAASYELAFTDPEFKFPQLWRSNLAVDQKLPFGLIGTAEFLYNRDVNGIYYINANLQKPNTAFVGADARPRWTTTNRINSKVDNAIVLKNQDKGYTWSMTAALERPFSEGLFAKAAYNYSEAKNTVDPGSIAFGSWNNNQHPGDPNNPGLAFSLNSPGHRVFATMSYRQEYFRFGATTLTLYWEGRTIGNGSFVFSGDLNGDGGTSNDMIYIPRDASEMNFETYSITTPSAKTFTAADQAAAWEAFIKQDKYLSANRGKYAERAAIFLPMLYRADFAIVQEVFTNIFDKRNALQVRADFMNVTNLINKNWGVGQRMVTTSPLISRGADSGGKALYRLREIGGNLVSQSFEQTAGPLDVFRFMLSVRYTFN